ncbi:unnamed protein product, partial [Symbiodinium microadriaticum]
VDGLRLPTPAWERGCRHEQAVKRWEEFSTQSVNIAEWTSCSLMMPCKAPRLCFLMAVPELLGSAEYQQVLHKATLGMQVSWNAHGRFTDLQSAWQLAECLAGGKAPLSGSAAMHLNQCSRMQSSFIMRHKASSEEPRLLMVMDGLYLPLLLSSLHPDWLLTGYDSPPVRLSRQCHWQAKASLPQEHDDHSALAGLQQALPSNHKISLGALHQNRCTDSGTGSANAANAANAARLLDGLHRYWSRSAPSMNLCELQSVPDCRWSWCPSPILRTAVAASNIRSALSFFQR